MAMESATVRQSPPAPAGFDDRAPGGRGVEFEGPGPQPPRPRVEGRFLFQGSRKLWVRGVTYGTFRPDADGLLYPTAPQVERDFAAMREHGINAVRTYTPAPRRILDAAGRHGLRVLVGLNGERFIGEWCDGARRPDLDTWLEPALAAAAGHPALLGFVLANEFPSSSVRWLGPERARRALDHLATRVRAADPEALLTYANYPTTEYLELPFLDFLSFNVFLESPERLSAYLARLHHLAGSRPLVMTELGLDSLRHGEDAQAESVTEQLGRAFDSGCAGAFAYSWTDEWYCGGKDISDWAFGLTRSDRSAKPALAAAARVFRSRPRPAANPPRIAVVVCSHNGAHVIGDCLDGLARLEYPDFEVLVVDDGSTDRTGEIARARGVRVIRTEHQGLAVARNAGARATSGEIVAYLDDDAWPDPDWLTFLAAAFRDGTWAGIGGPNLPPPDDGWMAQCVAQSPGGPAHVMVDDLEAEHLPGCNMAFRRHGLEAVGGFDPRFAAAGDDVDLCWRFQDVGLRLGFHPGAVVWHRRRATLSGYWRQQAGYGRAEALLEAKWPARYNAAGHVAWRGRIYAPTLAAPFISRTRIYGGSFGTAAYQSRVPAPPDTFTALALTPEGHLASVTLAGTAALSARWMSPAVAWTLAALALAIPLGAAARGAACAEIPRGLARRDRMARRIAIAVLHLLQPWARLAGRLERGLTPWRRRGPARPGWPIPRRWRIQGEDLPDAPGAIEQVRSALRAEGAVAECGGDFAGWDLEIRGGPLGGARLLASCEECGHGIRRLRLRAWPRPGGWALLLAAASVGIGVAAAAGPGRVAALPWLGLAGILGLGAAFDCGSALRAADRAIGRLEDHP